MTRITGTSFASRAITTNQLVSGITSPVITSIAICDSSYNVLDDTAANTTGSYIQVTGTNFTSNCQIVIGTSSVTSTSYVNTTTLRAQVQAFSAATYPVYVIDSYDGSTAIRVNGITFSNTPLWSTGTTLTGQTSGTAFGINLSATSDSNITYANTTALPAGTSLLANGYFYGTASPVSTTTYNFDVKATDAELQDATRTFSVTVTGIPQTRIYSWGSNQFGGLGLNDRVYRSSPSQVGSDTTWNSIDAGGRNNTLAIKNDNTLWGWGRNKSGELGTNDQIARSSPVQIGAGTTWNLVKTGFYTTMAIKSNGTLWGWGESNNGVLGLNDQIARSSPVQIGTGTNWSKLSVGYVSTAAIKTDGTLWCWGANFSGQLGTNDQTYRSSPVQIGTGTNWSQVKTVEAHTLALKTDGTLWVWGQNQGGQLGLNDIVYRSSPVQIGTGTNWSKISTGEGYSLMAIKTDGTLWAWGRNNFGQLGLNSVAPYRSSPVQVGTDTNWSEVSTALYATLAIKNNGTLWTWGRNNVGQLGSNDQIIRSSPVQIGTGTNWSKIYSGYYYSLAITSN